MLSRLIIRNYTLIDSLDISFSSQLNIVTGETGAGKSIILGALSLILGRRAESKHFFNQQKKCVIEGFFRINDYQLTGFFVDNDLDYESETILRREISADGKSRAFINDTPVTLTILKQLGEKLIDIHSQHATLEISDEHFQLLVLDTLAGNKTLLMSYQQSYILYKELLLQLKEAQQQADQAKIDQSYYQFLFDELEQINLKLGEQEELEQELDVLTHTADIKQNLLRATYLLTTHEQAALTQLKEIVYNLQQIEKYQPEIGVLAARLQSSLIEIKDIAAEIDHIDQLTQTNDSRLDELNMRLNTLYSLQKKHRVHTVAELLHLQHNFFEKLTRIQSSDEEIEKLNSAKSQLHQQLQQMAMELSNKRKHIIPEAEFQIQQTLAAVGMPHAFLKIENEMLAKGNLTKMGCDQIQFLFSANKGQPASPMHKVASGGELSRLMLSVKSLIARHTALPTIIFDEIDTGISGEVALKVGTIMQKLAENMQVIAITHLPQIASKGKAHYCVYKEEMNGLTHTNIKQLDETTRVVEIATMLSGQNPGEYALQNAKELLAV